MRSASGSGWRVLALAPLLGAPLVPTPVRADEPPAQGTAASADALDARRRDLRTTADAAAAAETARRQAEVDLETIRADHVRLNAALLDTTARVRAAETRTADIEKRLDLLNGSADAIKQSLQARRGSIAEILAVLQRMGLHPLPALLASPDDVLRAIRTSMLLGAVVPEMRSAAEALASDLAEHTRLRSAIVGQRDALSGEVVSLAAERSRLTELVAARQSAQTTAEGNLDGESRRSAGLARQATDLKDLVARLEADVASARRAADAARAADEARRRAAEADAASVDAKAAAGTRDPARLAPAMAFGDTRGQLTLPVAGRMIRSFGAADAYGGQEKGLSLETQPGALVTAPSDGWISFAGPYRSYGQLLIVNAGEGYYLVLAGMTRTDVVPGQFVLAGEPLGAMGDGSAKTASAIALGAAQPVLYVEFRKDGTAIDPSPWWAKVELEKVRG
ncbi:MAG: murein hydrolase activator EnvC family protein [Janthinobacterium lividum]